MSVKRSAYVATVALFRTAADDTILGQLAHAQTGDLTPAQRNAWLQQIKILREALPANPSAMLCFEYLIPRMGKRADNILLIGSTVIVIEFKVGSANYERSAIQQAVDYALDLKYFHAGSRDVTIVPVLVATQAPAREFTPQLSADGVATAMLANATNLAEALTTASALGSGPVISSAEWLRAGYSPTPTIIEASQTLYRGHGVEEITRFEAGADNLGLTTKALSGIIDHAQTTCEKAICLVTGVPGAGKTLAGLNLASERRRIDKADVEHAVFLSGNGPLVRVLQEALARDEVAQSKAQGRRIVKKDAERKAKAFIQNIHHFRDECLRNPDPPTERVVVFDEAQRAWDRGQTTKFMQQKRGHRDFDLSEPAFLIGAMNRHQGWAVVVCLVGGGQEINTGEAGMEEWLRALRDYYPDWAVYLPDQIAPEHYLPSMRPDDLGARVHHRPGLHLGVSIRSFRSEQLSAGIGALLSGDLELARPALLAIKASYPIRITRSLEAAKEWVRVQARGTERFGLLISSGARRLKPLGIVAGGVKGNECNWFLDNDQDVRSSYYLEDAATEFEVQGLELDWTIVVWDGDLIHDGNSDWIFRAFKGNKWQYINNKANQRFRRNAYRVLLTRARQGMVIVVPEGNLDDLTRHSVFYDPTWDYLESIGFEII